MLKTELRDATERDASTIAALAVQVFLDTYATEGVRPDLAREAFQEYSGEAFAARLADTNRHFVLAERENALQGFAEMARSEAESPVAGLWGAELIRLYVQPRAQRSGIGRALLASAEQAAASAALAALWLTVWEGNARALAFYAHMGYVDAGATTYSFQGNTYGNRVLVKRLPVIATVA